MPPPLHHHPLPTAPTTLHGALRELHKRCDPTASRHANEQTLYSHIDLNHAVMGPANWVAAWLTNQPAPNAYTDTSPWVVAARY